MVVHTCNCLIGEVETSRCLVSQPSPLSKLQTNERPCLKKKNQEVLFLRNNSRCCPPPPHPCSPPLPCSCAHTQFIIILCSATLLVISKELFRFGKHQFFIKWLYRQLKCTFSFTVTMNIKMRCGNF